MSLSKIAAGIVAGSLFVASAFAQNDECTGAVNVVDGVNGPFSNVGSTTSVPAWPCGAGGNDVWFLYVSTCTGQATFDTCSATRTYDTTIEVFDGTQQVCGSFTGGVCNDDFCGLGSTVTVNVTTGAPYWIRVGGFGGGTGNFDLTITCTGGGGGLPNDECTNPTVLNDGANGPFTNVGSTTSAPAWQCGGGGNDIWFLYVASCSGSLTFDTCSPNTTYDTTLEVFDASCGGCGTFTLGTCNDDSCGLQSSVTLCATQGQVFYVRVGGFVSATGNFDLNVNCAAGPCGGGGAGNDECAGATVANLGVNPGTNVGSTTSNPAWPCGAGANDVWYSFTATATAPHTFDTCSANTTYDSTLEVFSGNCTCPVSLGCNDDSCGLQSSLNVSLVQGQTYFVRVGGFGGGTGNFDLNISVGTGNGTIVLAQASTCAGGLTISVTGNPNLGGSITTALGGISGVPFFTYDIANPITAPGGCSPCPLLLGSFGWNFGTGNSLTVPVNPTYVGFTMFVQGVELTGVGGCNMPPALTLSDVYQITIG